MSTVAGLGAACAGGENYFAMPLRFGPTLASVLVLILVLILSLGMSWSLESLFGSWRHKASDLDAGW
jgi:hypothetical protein